ncbi:unnamed protein product [Mytilus coruscus]|uniref:B box-type domain-containing protein n=1 Tax=Mytilus coruscus TaxID=42192 RepID=A0A6J8BZX6_MYTCO|nr:unnamed protein product [Mytilus coruscus]
MASSTPVCSLCELRSITLPSMTWYITCDTGLCSECQEHNSSSKRTRNHNTVPVKDYQQLPIDILKISENCDKHNEKFTKIIVNWGYVTTFAENIYHTNNQTHCVTCYSLLDGKVQWTFDNICVLKEPRCISVDNNGNVFVVGKASNNVVVLSADGKQHKEILKASDDLLSPYTLDCNGSY